jgi:glutamate-ammonia-ligase adenylyltransferase
MALTRARPVFGSPGARTAVQAIIDETLHRPRDLAKLRADAAKMRGDIATHKPPAGPLDVKLVEGGLVDAEFAVHVLQLGEKVGFDPDLAAAIATLEGQGLLAAGFGSAFALLTRMLITLRLVAPDSAEPTEASRTLVAYRCGHDDWGGLMAAYDAARALIAGEWRRISSS